MNSRALMLLNIAGYQVAWFACVLGAAHGMWWLGPLIVLPFVIIHVRGAGDARAEASLLILTAVLGSLFDQVLLLLGWVSYPPSPLPNWLLPIWMSALWLSFATTLNVSIRWLREKPIAASIFGAVGGPLAYGAGVRLGAMTWSPARPVAIVVAVGFAAIVPLLFQFSKRFDGYRSVQR